MIIVDFQQVMIASIMMQMGFSGGKIEIPMFKHMALNSLRSYKQKYSSRYGEMVIACDVGSSWRRTRFPYYKANRTRDKEESSLDWESMHEAMREVRSDLREYFPYRIIEVEGAEADDIIGTLVQNFGSDFPGGEPILILSADKDFKQLQKFMNVEQYDPVRNKKVVENNPEDFLIEHIIRGDSSDGVPNVFSSDDSIVMRIRQNSVTQKRLAETMSAVKNNTGLEEQINRNYNRNKMMIDLSFTPKALQSEILEQYESQEGKGRDKIFGYLLSNRMKHLIEFVNDF